MAKPRQLTSIELAIKLYYSTYELTNDNIKALFGLGSSSAVNKLKNEARKKMAEKDLIPLTAFSVNTRAAYEAWGLEINDLEERLKKLRKLGLAE